MENLSLAVNVIFVGITVVFLSLIVLSFCITLFVKILGLKKNRAESADSVNNQTPISETNIDNETGVSGIGSADSEFSDQELVAVLTAAIMASGRTRPDSKIRIASYRRVPLNSPAWNAAGRAGIISGRL
jgi:Na+-transporting methylmalonyl-CoA/oxaloacetate decarboxylase gamma subunit